MTKQQRKILRKTWSDMLTRCQLPSSKSYRNYGGRGIRVCERWANSFESFAEDMGPRPAGLTPTGHAEYSIDRINNDGNYEPSNCRWATISEQHSNKKHRNDKKPTVMHDESLFLREWSARLGGSDSLVQMRLWDGVPLDVALTRPYRAFRKYITHNGITMSQTEWSLALGARPSLVCDRMRRGWTEEAAVTTPCGRSNAGSPKPLTVGGVTMSLTDHSRRMGLRVHVVRRRLENGWRIEEALSIPMRPLGGPRNLRKLPKGMP